MVVQSSTFEVTLVVYVALGANRNDLVRVNPLDCSSIVQTTA